MGNVTIIGAGFIGLCSAYYLDKEGFDVTVIERGDITDGCSFGNMGFISPSHFMPLASPGIVSEGFRHMLSNKSPFYIKPRLNGDFLRWLFQFYRNCNKNRAIKNSVALHDLLQLSRRLIEDLKNDFGNTFQLQEKGCLMMCKEKKTLEHEYLLGENAEKLGLRIERLNSRETQILEPDVELNIAGSVLYNDDCHFNPNRLMKEMHQYFLKRGVKFLTGITVEAFEKSGDNVKAVITDQGKYECENLVIATGSWLPEMARLMGFRLLLQPGKGYSYTYDFIEKNIKYPAILVDGRCAITPWGHQLRIGGTMELSGINNKVLVQRMEGIYSSVKMFYPGLSIDPPVKEKIWHGLRPVTPDGLPYIGKAPLLKNVVFAGGHAMLGISLGTGTGKLVSQLMKNEKTSVDLTRFDPTRFK